jgi:NAD(P)-dependent dehydrogenase (short-subunit alcohol dehydrogenase family)
MKTAIVTGASQGIGAGIVKAYLERGFNVVANSRKMTESREVKPSDRVAAVDGHIGELATAAKIVETALARFGSIDALVNNAGIFFLKPFTDYTAEDFRSLVSTNLEGFLYVTQHAGPEEGWKHHNSHRISRPQSHQGNDRCCADDHQGRPGNCHAASCDGIRFGRHPRECRRSWCCRHAASQQDATGADAQPFADGQGIERTGHH